MRKHQSFTFRIILAIILMFGFYILAIAIAGGLLAIPYFELVATGKLHIKLALVCVIGGLVILWSILPRWDKFEAPGPQLTPDKHPRLFQALQKIADATDQTMPKEVYAVPEMNAWVSNRGGVMGIGSRRVMGLGVPLMQVLNQRQFLAVLAHEFGHYHAGDTALGPWIHVTRASIFRTVQTLAESESFLSKPFEWYGYLFMRITQAISRAQEYSADALAAEVVGPDALIDGLKVIYTSANAFDAYWKNEYVPILEAGYQAPLGPGFDYFYSTAKIKQQLAEMLEKELKEGNSDPYDSHPALALRIAELQQYPEVQHRPSTTPAIELLENIPKVENQMIAHLARAVKVERPKLIDWDDVVEKVLMPSWREAVKSHGKVVMQETVGELGLAAYKLENTVKKSNIRFPKNIPAEYHQFAWLNAAGCLLSLALHDAGWQIESPPGSPILASLDGHTLEPFNLLNELAEQKLTPEQYLATVNRADVADLPLRSDSAES